MTKTEIIIAIILCAAVAAFAIVMLNLCDNYGNNYKYTYEIEVEFMDKTIDTISTTYNSLKENPVYFTLKIENSGVLMSGGSMPCLMMGCGLDQGIIAAGVLDFRILSETKEVIDE